MADNSKAYAAGGMLLGGVLLWSALKNRSILSVAQASVRGQSPLTAKSNPETAPTTNAIGEAASLAGNVGIITTSSAIANDALKYVGHCYKYGGAPGPDGSGCWDCSSFVNWVLSHDLGLPIPIYGRSWNPSSHGPPAIAYSTYGTGVPRANVQAGDLCVYQTHIGIAISNDQMVSAETPANGTRTSTIDGMTQSLGEVLICRRVP